MKIFRSHKYEKTADSLCWTGGEECGTLQPFTEVPLEVQLRNIWKGLEWDFLLVFSTKEQQAITILARLVLGEREPYLGISPDLLISQRLLDRLFGNPRLSALFVTDDDSASDQNKGDTTVNALAFRAS